MRNLALAAMVLGIHAAPATAFQAGAIHHTSNTPILKVNSPPLSGWVAGTRVSCNWKGAGAMYSGIIARQLGGSRIRVHYDDGDRETTSTSMCRILAARPSATGASPSAGWGAGTRVSCNWKGRGAMYRGVIARRMGGSRIRVHYNDGDRETTTISQCRLR